MFYKIKQVLKEVLISVFWHGTSQLYHVYSYDIILVPWYNYNVSHCPCRLIARQYEVEIRVYYIDHLGKFDYGPAHANRNHRYTYVSQQKRANPMESVESSYNQLNNCFLAIASFYKVYYAYKSLTFFLKQVSRVF